VRTVNVKRIGTGNDVYWVVKSSDAMRAYRIFSGESAKADAIITGYNVANRKGCEMLLFDTDGAIVRMGGKG
jgi:hypothetical protein